MSTFTTARKRRDPITFTIDDDEFEFDPPKLAGPVLALLDRDDDGDGRGALKANWDWLTEGLRSEDVERLRARLADPDDGLDIDTLAEVARWLAGQVSGRPTGPRDGS